MFVTFEGIGGAGKTTQVELLRRILESEGRPVVATREPGGTPLGEDLRQLLLYGQEIGPWAEASLFAAARAELVDKVILPALERGADVLCDRYVDSSLAYQGIARGIGVDDVLEVNLRATRGLLPDRTFVLLLDPSQARRRRGKTDRIEADDPHLLDRLDHAYRQLAELFPRRVVPIEATLSPQDTAHLIREHLRDLS